MLSLFPACCIFISRSLASASDSGYSSASRAQVLLSQMSTHLHISFQPPLQSSAGWLSSQSQRQSHIATDGQSVCLSWCRDLAGALDQMLIFKWKLLSCPCGAPSLARGRVCHLSVIVDSISPLSLCTLIYNWLVAPVLFFITPRRGSHRERPVSKGKSVAACAFVSAVTCIPSSCSETIDCLFAYCIATVVLVCFEVFAYHRVYTPQHVDLWPRKNNSRLTNSRSLHITADIGP
jgi:hypothetical protein